jgi:hypothetical protein
MQGDGHLDRSIHTGNAQVNQINIAAGGQHQNLWTQRMKFRGGVSYRGTYPLLTTDRKFDPSAQTKE